MINLRVSADHETVQADSSQPSYGYHHICVSVDDIDTAHQELTGKGIEFIADPMNTPDARIAFFRGPDNIVIEVLLPYESALNAVTFLSEHFELNLITDRGLVARSSLAADPAHRDYLLIPKTSR